MTLPTFVLGFVVLGLVIGVLAFFPSNVLTIGILGLIAIAFIAGLVGLCYYAKFVDDRVQAWKARKEDQNHHV